MELSKKEYSQYVKEMSPNSPFWKDLFNAFWVGGLICVVGQMILNGFTAMGLDETDAGTATSVSMVFLGALLTGLSVYDDIAKIGGAGTLVPITGFSNAVVSPAIESKSEGLITGLAANIFIIAGPVLVYGITASAVYGIIYWIWTML